MSTPSLPNNSAVNWITLLLKLSPDLIPLGKSIAELFKLHPQLKPEDLASFVAMIHAGGDELAAFIMADKAAHGG